MTHNPPEMILGVLESLAEVPRPRGGQRPPLGPVMRRLAPGGTADDRGDRPEGSTQNGKPHFHRDHPFSIRATEDAIPGPESRQVYTG
jgi:hypothetical protein